MTSRRTFACTSLFAIGLAIVAPVTVSAQDDVPTFAPSTIIVTAADGTESQYTINDLGIYLSSSPAYDDVPATVDFSLSLTVISPIDAKLLEWAAQGGSEETADRDIAIVATMPGADGAANQEVRYEITGAHITSLSTSHSTYAAPSVSLSLSADKLVIDGVAMN